MHILHILASSLLLVGAIPVAAQTVLSGDHSIDGRLCAGVDCTGSEVLNDNSLKLRSVNLRLWFADSSTAPGDPSGDWQFVVNENFSGGSDFFALRDVNGNGQVFRVDGGAPQNALRVDARGQLGLGTAFPDEKLHLMDGDTPTIRLEQDGSGGNPAGNWEIEANHLWFFVKDGNDTTGSHRLPIQIYSGAGNDYALTINGNGYVGFGALPPSFPLHLVRVDGTAQLRIQEYSTSTTPRTLVSLLNNGRPEIVLGNTATGGEWSFGAGSNFVLKQGAVGTASSSKTKLFEIQPNGNAILTGTLTTGGTTCGGGCDLVFADGYDLPSIADHAEAMFALGHLPNVGPTPEGAPVNLTDKLGRMLNELEHAHVYIAQQERDIRDQSALIAKQRRTIARLSAELETLAARLAALEQRIAD